MTDPNWFYSTISQSSAAIISLLGAILVSRLIDHSSRLYETKHRLEADLTAKTRDLINIIDPRYLPNHLSNKDRDILSILHALWNKERTYTVSKLKKTITQHTEIIREFEGTGYDNLLDISKHYGFEYYIIECEEYGRKLYPINFYIAFIIMAGLAFFGIVRPIYKLSGFDNSIATYFLICVSLLFLWVGWQLYDLWNKNRIIVRP